MSQQAINCTGTSQPKYSLTLLIKRKYTKIQKKLTRTINGPSKDKRNN